MQQVSAQFNIRLHDHEVDLCAARKLSAGVSELCNHGLGP